MDDKKNMEVLKNNERRRRKKKVEGKKNPSIEFFSTKVWYYLNIFNSIRNQIKKKKRKKQSKYQTKLFNNKK